MDKKKIIDYIDQNDFSEIEELINQDDLFLVRFHYDFEDCVLEAAKAYANSESNYEKESKEWFLEFVIPYLYDYANDEVLEIIEEIVEDNDISGEVMAVQMSPENINSVQFIALFTNEDSTVSIEDVVKDFIA